MANVADYNVANASGASVRSDINNILQAVVTLNSGTSEPSTMYPFMIWVDTTNNLVKMRNGANDGWLTMPFAMNASDTAPNGLTVSGGDLTVDTSTLKVDSTNNLVGVGTASPNSYNSNTNNFVIRDSGSGGMTISTGASSTGYVAFNDGEDTTIEGLIAYNQSNDVMSFRTASTDDRLVIDGSGNIGMGTASPSTNLHIYSTANNAPHLLLENYQNADTDDAAVIELYLNDETTGGIGDNTDVGVIRFTGDEKDGGSKETYAEIRGVAHDPGQGASNKGNLSFFVQAAGDLNETLTLDEKNVGIGTASPAYELEIVDSSGDANLSVKTTSTNNSARLRLTANGTGNSVVMFADENDTNVGLISYDHSDDSMNFSVADSQRIRLDSSGNLLVGTTSTTINSSNFGICLFADGRPKFSKNVTGGSHVMNVYGNAGEFRVYGDGDVQNTNNSYAGISDQSVKENIVDATDKLEDLKQVQIRNYNLINDDLKQIGVIAQELEPIFPGLIKECNETGIKAVKYSVFVPILIKAIQELEARVAELEAA